MKYMMLVCADEANELSTEEAGQVDRAANAWVEEMTRRGIRLAGQRLRPVSDATTVQVRGGEVLIADGPFAETKEQLLGFYLVNADDLEEVLAFCKELGAANPGGAYEVRPLHFFANGSLPAEAVAAPAREGAPA